MAVRQRSELVLIQSKGGKSYDLWESGVFEGETSPFCKTRRDVTSKFLQSFEQTSKSYFEVLQPNFEA